MVLDSPGGCCEPICAFFLFNCFWFWILQEVAVNPFAHFFVWILMVLDSPGGCCEAICLFFYLNIDGFGFSGGCCEAICKLFCLNINGFGFSRGLLWSHLHICFIEILMVLDSPGSCCEAICTLFFSNIDSFGFSRTLLWSHLRICLFKYLWFCILQDFAVKQFAHLVF